MCCVCTASIILYKLSVHLPVHPRFVGTNVFQNSDEADPKTCKKVEHRTLDINYITSIFYNALNKKYGTIIVIAVTNQTER